MVVGEPTLMGGELGQEDERKIVRLQNSTYDTATHAATPSQTPGATLHEARHLGDTGAPSAATTQGYAISTTTTLESSVTSDLGLGTGDRREWTLSMPEVGNWDESEDHGVGGNDELGV